MKIAITPISLSGLFKNGKMDIEGFINYCAELEIDGIDVLDSSSYPWFWKDKQRELAALPRLLEKSGLKLAACATGNNFAKLDPQARRENIDIVKNALCEAGELGAPFLRVFGGYHQESGGDAGVDYDNGLRMIIEGLEECVPEAERHGVVIVLENHGRLPGHSYEIAAIMNHFHSPWLRVLFDCANFMGNGMDEPENPLRAYENLKEYVAHVHIKDMGPCVTGNHRKIEGYVAGKGTVPLRQFAALLENNNYDGFCSLEYEADPITPEIHGVPESITYLKRIRAIHQMLKNI